MRCGQHTPERIAKICSAIKSFPDANREASPFAIVAAAAVTTSLLKKNSVVVAVVVEAEDSPKLNEIESESSRTRWTSAGVLCVQKGLWPGISAKNLFSVARRDLSDDSIFIKEYVQCC